MANALQGHTCWAGHPLMGHLGELTQQACSEADEHHPSQNLEISGEFLGKVDDGNVQKEA